MTTIAEADARRVLRARNWNEAANAGQVSWPDAALAIAAIQTRMGKEPVLPGPKKEE